MANSKNTDFTGNLQGVALDGHCAPLNADADSFVAQLVPPPAPAGPFTIDIAVESSTPQANPSRPQFLKSITINAVKEDEWNSTVLPYIRLLSFTVASTTDVFFIGAMLIALPSLVNSILKIDISGFHWFSGISDNRRSNPFMVLASNLPSLREMHLTLHTSMMTDSKWGERQLFELERTDPDQAKERRVRSVSEITGRYGMALIFRSSALEYIRLVYIKSEMVTAFVVEGNLEVVLTNLRNWLVQGFREQGREIVVELSLAA
ncbi:uncharacterized protein ALTATR162_LOCUS11384 [Alternaria atra]|uniref:Uncharacterized protein n=1 Tax=Alternaria atra TaxID=119953 RepID=A0A8J2INW4_9PLEO|nr:uncharacterized protein ALTATR162_LOCUS11384 [Alternaria atra]CAG5185715.1 unnamed protein product [Alternaria atra]